MAEQTQNEQNYTEHRVRHYSCEKFNTIRLPKNAGKYDSFEFRCAHCGRHYFYSKHRLKTDEYVFIMLLLPALLILGTIGGTLIKSVLISLTGG